MLLENPEKDSNESGTAGLPAEEKSAVFNENSPR